MASNDPLIKCLGIPGGPLEVAFPCVLKMISQNLVPRPTTNERALRRGCLPSLFLPDRQDIAIHKIDVSLRDRGPEPTSFCLLRVSANRNRVLSTFNPGANCAKN